MSRLTISTREQYRFGVCRSGGKLPRRRHESADAARADAAEQSRERPGATFIVFEEVARVAIKKSDPVESPRIDRTSRAAPSPDPRRPAQPGGAHGVD